MWRSLKWCADVSLQNGNYGRDRTMAVAGVQERTTIPLAARRQDCMLLRPRYRPLRKPGKFPSNRQVSHPPHPHGVVDFRRASPLIHPVRGRMDNLVEVAISLGSTSETALMWVPLEWLHPTVFSNSPVIHTMQFAPPSIPNDP